MHAIEIDRSPGLPSFRVTTRRRLMPQGTSCSFLQAVTQALHSMQRTASQRNFIRAMESSRLCRLDLAKRHLRLLHPRRGVVAVGGELVHAVAENIRVAVLRILEPKVDTLEPTAEVVRHPDDTFADP